MSLEFIYLKPRTNVKKNTQKAIGKTGCFFFLLLNKLTNFVSRFPWKVESQNYGLNRTVLEFVHAKNARDLSWYYCILNPNPNLAQT